jgi:uncharacterized protein (TIGR02453 family)
VFTLTLQFLQDLKVNNHREWFQDNKSRYRKELVEPAQAFIEAFAPALARISPYFVADPRPSGGSLFRIYRDTRFAADKTPYKTHVGIHFRHEDGKNAHCPGLYVHIDHDESFIGAGMWHPEREVLKRIRQAIMHRPEHWSNARSQLGDLTLGGESLKRPPRGYPADHPWIDDLKRLDFMVMVPFPAQAPLQEGVRSAEQFGSRAAPLMRFLCGATGHPY